jgi:site-specific DNA recombinase
MSTPANGTPTARTIRCAIYTRKSTEEGLDQDFNSLEAQRAAAEAYIASQHQEGWLCLPARYDDGGYSGGTLDRPALQRLRADLATGQIDCVLTYKVDRLSRSLLDFAALMACLDEHHVAFVSVTQQFNTATSMGRLILNVLLSFAQFERELIAERTRDKIAAARRQGKWVGGMPLLGYDVDPHGSKLRVNAEEAERVRAIFALYLHYGALPPVLQELQRRGWRTKRWTTRQGRPRGGRRFRRGALRRLLTCITYRGQVRYRHEVHPGEHPALVDGTLWQAVQDLLQQQRRARGARGPSAALLQGLLRCGPCGCAMTHSQTTKGTRRYRYYVCTAAQKHGWHTCPAPAVPAGAIEQLVCAHVPAALPEGVAANNAMAWDTLAPAEQAQRLRRLIQRVDYDGTQGQVSILCQPEGGQVAVQAPAPAPQEPTP